MSKSQSAFRRCNHLPWSDPEGPNRHPRGAGPEWIRCLPGCPVRRNRRRGRPAEEGYHNAKWLSRNGSTFVGVPIWRHGVSAVHVRL